MVLQRHIWAHGQSSRQTLGHLLLLVQGKRRAQPSLSLFLQVLGFQTCEQCTQAQCFVKGKRKGHIPQGFHGLY